MRVRPLTALASQDKEDVSPWENTESFGLEGIGKSDSKKEMRDAMLSLESALASREGEGDDDDGNQEGLPVWCHGRQVSPDSFYKTQQNMFRMKMLKKSGRIEQLAQFF